MCVAYDNEYTASTACSVVQAHTPPCARLRELQCCGAAQQDAHTWGRGQLGAWASGLQK